MNRKFIRKILVVAPRNEEQSEEPLIFFMMRAFTEEDIGINENDDNGQDLFFDEISKSSKIGKIMRQVHPTQLVNGKNAEAWEVAILSGKWTLLQKFIEKGLEIGCSKSWLELLKHCISTNNSKMLKIMLTDKTLKNKLNTR